MLLKAAMPEVKVKDLSRIVLEMLASLNVLKKQQDGRLTKQNFGKYESTARDGVEFALAKNYSKT